MQITFNAFAYKAKHHDMKRIESGKELPYIWKWADCDSETQIGTATVTVNLFPADERNAKELDALNKQLQATRAENQRRENAILDQISKLQAIGYEVEV